MFNLLRAAVSAAARRYACFHHVFFICLSVIRYYEGLDPKLSISFLSLSSLRQIMSKLIKDQGEVAVVEHTSSSRHVPLLMPVNTRIVMRGDRKCISDVIASALSLGLMGYPYIMADGISEDDKEVPDM